MAKKLSDLLKNSWDIPAASHTSYRPAVKKPGFAQDSFDFLKLIEKWPEIVGAKLAQETTPLKNRYKTLTVLTRHAAFSQQISFMEEILKKKIIQVFPSLTGKIDRINFQCNPQAFHEQVQRVQKMGMAPVEEKKPIIHPFSPEYKKLKREADEIFNHVDDEQMKESLFNLYLQFETEKNR